MDGPGWLAPRNISPLGRSPSGGHEGHRGSPRARSPPFIKRGRPPPSGNTTRRLKTIKNTCFSSTLSLHQGICFRMEGPRWPRLKTCLVLRLLKKLKNTLLSTPSFFTLINCLRRWKAKFAKTKTFHTQGQRQPASKTDSSGPAARETLSEGHLWALGRGGLPRGRGGLGLGRGGLRRGRGGSEQLRIQYIEYN